jgi:hypothetical protein
MEQLTYLPDKSSCTLTEIGDYIFLSVEVYLQNTTNEEINFHLRIVFEDPILKRELGNEVNIGEEINNFKPLDFNLKPRSKAGLFGGSFKIEKSQLTENEIQSITNDVKVIIFDDQGHERRECKFFCVNGFPLNNF